MTPEIEKAEALMRKQHILVLSGLPASGKSTEAMKWFEEDPDNRFRLNYDNLRLLMFGADWKWNRADEDRMQEEGFRLAVDAIGKGQSVCIDNTNLTYKDRAKWVTLANASGVPVEIFEMPTPVETCVLRDHARGRTRVGRAVIERMALFNGQIDLTDKELYPRDFIVVDMDGTLSDSEWRADHIRRMCRGCQEIWRPNDEQCWNCAGREATPKDWDTFFRMCGDDSPIYPVVELVKTLSSTYDVLVVTGRPIDKAGKPTEDWLRAYDIPCRHLFMPQFKTHDTEAKEQIIELLPLDRIAYSIDDRDRSVALWRKHNICTLQVAPGAF